jgi:nondiscriminating glutamyl-tRNA synthetase
MHIGTARTALFNYIFAKKNNGSMLLRIEDTDRKRSTLEHERGLIENTHWLGIHWDNEVVLRQSERGEVYSEYLQKLIETGKAYYSKEEVTEEGQRAEVIRFKNPNVRITFTDLIRGEVSFDTTELGDFIIARSVTEPLYHLAVVIDDALSQVTHVIRGEDHISNTPRQILILEALGFTRPLYGHMPLILSTEREKLSKRKHGELVSVEYYRKRGYLPEALVNFLAMLGWNPGTNQEILSLEEIITQFDIKKVQKAGAVFNVEKLNWFNKEYLKREPVERVHTEISTRLKSAGFPEEKINPPLLATLSERIFCYGEIDDLYAAGEFTYIQFPITYEPSFLLWKDNTKEQTNANLAAVLALWEHQDFSNSAQLKESLAELLKEKGNGPVLYPLRACLTGKKQSPDPFTVACILGKTETLKRIKAALEMVY